MKLQSEFYPNAIQITMLSLQTILFLPRLFICDHHNYCLMIFETWSRCLSIAEKLEKISVNRVWTGTVNEEMVC